MADIVLCTNKVCPLKTNCHRAQAVPESNQKTAKPRAVRKFVFDEATKSCKDQLPILPADAYTSQEDQ